MKTNRTLESILREFDIEIVDGARNRSRTARQTCADQTLENIFRRRGGDHIRSVLMSIVETKRNEPALVAPVIWAMSDILLVYPVGFGNSGFTIMDAVDLVEMFGRASANRRIALPRRAIATQLLNAPAFSVQGPRKDERLRQSDQPARRMAA